MTRDQAPRLPQYTAERDATTLLLFRHGQSQANVGGAAEQDTDSPLTAQGEQQALALAQACEQTAVAAILSSDLRRAQDTVAPLARSQNQAVLTSARLREPRGPQKEAAFVDPGQAALLLEQLRAGLAPPAPPPPETHAKLVARLRSFLEEELPLPAGGTVVICSHHGTLNVLSRLLLGHHEPPASRWAHFGNGSVTRIDIPAQRRPPSGTLLYLNWVPFTAAS
jgi:probable phosphoglycerate mutase